MSQLEQVTRVITIANAIVDFPIIIAAGIEVTNHSGWVFHDTEVAIWHGFIPLAFSVGSAIWYLRRKEKAANKISTILDLLTFLGYLALLLVIWIRDPQWLNNHGQTLVLDIYATVPLIINM